MLKGLVLVVVARRMGLGGASCLMQAGVSFRRSKVIRLPGLVVTFRDLLLTGKAAFVLVGAIWMIRPLLKLVIYRPLLALEAT